jgi:hypothetical protein
MWPLPSQSPHGTQRHSTMLTSPVKRCYGTRSRARKGGDLVQRRLKLADARLQCFNFHAQLIAMTIVEPFFA